MSVRAFRAVLALALAILPVASAACSSAADSTDAAIRQFCENLVASPAFACCSAGDKAERQFASRNRYGSSADCTAQLLRSVGQSNGRRGYDGAAASSCLNHLASRSCKALPTSAARTAEEAAGCSHVIVGVQAEGKACDTSEDCRLGLFCPPNRDTGVATCARPAAATETCLGTTAINAVDHPTCQPGLFCQLVGDNPGGCPSPPCNDFRCVPFFDEGELCTGLECGAGLSCASGSCQKAGLSGLGGPCRLTENCADGLYCAPTGACEPRKANGEACGNAADANLAFQCKGICVGDGAGRCGSFCSGN